MKKSFKTLMNIVNKINLRIAKNHSCRDCKFFNDGDVQIICEFCDVEFNDCFELKEGGEVGGKT